MTPALGCAVAWCVGVAAGVVLAPERPWLGVLAAGLAALPLALAPVTRPVWTALAVAAALLGLARAEIPATDPSARARAPALAGQQVLLEGRVADDARQLGAGYEVLVAPTSISGQQGLRRPAGNVLVRVRTGSPPAVGDIVDAGGRLRLPVDLPTFDRRAYLAQRQAYLELPATQLSLVKPSGDLRGFPALVRAGYRDGVQALLPPPHAAVLVAVVLGIRSGIPSRLQADLVATGLVHLLVLSGLKVAVFARIVTAVLAPLLGRSATLPGIALVALYALIGGASPAAVRASAMGCLVLVAGHLGRPTHVWTSLAATAAAMLAWHPELAWDVGFQLSFAGTAAIVLLTPGIERRLGWIPAWLREPFAVTCAAQVGTVPLMAADFHLLSPAAPIANALVLPVLPAMIGAGILVAPLAALPDVGRLLALPLAGLLIYLEQVAGWLARLPLAAVSVPAFPPWSGVAYYLGVGAAVAAVRVPGRARMAAIAVGVLAPLAIGAGELAAWSRPAPSVAVFAVGDGQAVLLTGPAGRILIDGGPSPAVLSNELGARLPPWQRELAALIITGPGRGHTGGLTGFDLPVRTVVVPATRPDGVAWRTAALAAAARGAGIQPAVAGERLRLAGLDVDVLESNGQLALRLSLPGGRSFCDLADLDPEAQVAAAPRLRGGCDELLLPSGGRSALAPDLMRAAHPGVLIASLASGRLARDLPAGLVQRTDQEGTIVLPL